VVRLGDGTPVSHERMQAAVDAEWPWAAELFEVVKGNGPCNAQRLSHRVRAHEDGAWVREAAAAYAAKQAARERGAA
jgi:1,2-phenylacetyl-CoA epoxidase catalytic subunit